MLGLTGHLFLWKGFLSDAMQLLCSVPPALFAGSIFLVERRGKRERLNPRRHVDISTLLESIPEAAFIIDKENRIIDANSAAAEMLGVTRDDLLRTSTHQISRALADVTDGNHRSGPLLARALKGEAVRHERRLVHSLTGGENLELLISATPMRDERGDVIAALLIARDVTELHALQRRMGDVERHLAIGQMAAALAHDFNNILAAIGQAAYILQNNKSASEQERRTFLDIIQNTVHKGSEVIGRVREYLRTGSGATTLVDMRQVILDAIELTRPLAAKCKTRVTTEMKPVGNVRANAADLRRVYTNLIINAMEAMSEGGHIMLTCQEREGEVVTTVSDNGSGIPLEVREKIFFPYFTTKQKGTGLGLSGAQKIVLSQGGNITFRTETGKGTTFIVTMPLASTAKSPEKKEKEKKDKKPAA